MRNATNIVAIEDMASKEVTGQETKQQKEVPEEVSNVPAIIRRDGEGKLSAPSIFSIHPCLPSSSSSLSNRLKLWILGYIIRITTKSDKNKARFISLDGLLDYRIKDTMERYYFPSSLF